MDIGIIYFTSYFSTTLFGWTRLILYQIWLIAEWKTYFTRIIVLLDRLKYNARNVIRSLYFFILPRLSPSLRLCPLIKSQMYLAK